MLNAGGLRLTAALVILIGCVTLILRKAPH
jgi:hypothetical protein